MFVVLSIFCMLLAWGDDEPELEWRLAQLTECNAGFAVKARISDDARTVAFISNCDLTGNNYDRSPELFSYRLGKLTQLTSQWRCEVLDLSMDASGKLIAISSTCNFTGKNDDKNPEIFLFEDGQPIRQITETRTYYNNSVWLDASGKYLAFRSFADFTNENLDHSSEIFTASLDSTKTEFIQVSSGKLEHECNSPMINAGVVAFQCNNDPYGTNKDGNVEIFAAALSSKPMQITQSLNCLNQAAQVNNTGNQVLFQSSCNLVGDNLSGYQELFLARGSKIEQLTKGTGEGCWNPRLSSSGKYAVFSSRRGRFGANSDRSLEVFRLPLDKTDARPEPIYELKLGDAMEPVIDHAGTTVVFCSTTNPLRSNPDAGPEIFLATSRLDANNQDQDDMSDTP